LTFDFRPTAIGGKELLTLKLWFCYFLSFMPAVPGLGKLLDADCIFVQAFGRNKYTDEELNKVLGKFRKMAKYNDLETFKLLRQDGFDPGKSNLSLGLYAMRLYNLLNGAPIIAQWEVAYAIFQTDSVWFMRHTRFIDCIWPPEEGYFATAHVKQESKEKMVARGRVRPVEVAHPAMITRAVPIIWGTGVSPIVEEIRLGEAKNHLLWVWDENSVQPWTTSWSAWQKREFVGRMAHIFTYCLARVGLLYSFISLVPEKFRGMVPGDWIALRPPHQLEA
jgi:hypothetical protein